MKAKNTKALLALALLTGGLASCSVEEQEIPASEQYAREFYKTFGTKWSSEGFNVVEQKTVHVSSTKPTHVLIYEVQAGEYRLAADYDDVTDKTITFDGMKGDNTPFLVTCDNAAFYVENGGTVTFNPQGVSSKSNSPLRTSVVPAEAENISLSNEYTEITCDKGDETFKQLSTNNGQAHEIFTVSYKQFLNVKNRANFTMYPVYWNSPKKHTVGFYYYDSSYTKHEVPVYTDKGGDELQFKVGGEYTTTLENAEDCWNYGDKGNVTYTDEFQFRAKGYTVTATQDAGVGIYVEVDGKKYYSNSDENGGDSYFAYKHIGQSSSGYTYFMFDDPDDNGGIGDRDFNDLVIYCPQTMTPTSTETVGWTVACEDLGGTFDYDFNDIVFQVYHVSGQKWLSIVPVAAGGTLPAYLYFTRNNKDWPISKEWHQHFGETDNTYSSSTMINTCYGGADYERTVQPIQIELGSGNFTMITYTNEFDDAGRFLVKVKRADGEIESINAPGQAKEPQVLVLPVDWRWPKELVRINTIYPTFGTWGEGYVDGATNNWVNNIQNADNLTEKNFYLHVKARDPYTPPTK